MFEYFAQAGAKVILFDAILTSQVNELEDNQFLERLSSFENLIVGVDFTKNENVSNTESLAEIFSEKFSFKLFLNAMLLLCMYILKSSYRFNKISLIVV